MNCPCKSGKPYQSCCEPLHKGQLPKSAEALMRSRYAAYALALSEYVIATTHPNNPATSKNLVQWKKEIEAFSKETEFEDLQILRAEEGQGRALVEFLARLSQHGQDCSFRELSTFEKVNGRWLYLSGKIA